MAGEALAGSRIVVVGGSSGIGLAVARAAQSAGAEVIVASRNPERCSDDLPGVETVGIDVTDEQSVERTFAGIGPFDHLVCTAAGGFPPGLYRAPESAVRELMEIKFWGQYRCGRYASPLIREGGSITLSSGIRSRRPLPGSGAFTVVNMAVEGLTRSMALELAPIRVNAISPGTVDTPVFAGFTEEQKAKHFERAAAQTTVGRIGNAEEVAEFILAVMSNGFLSGAVIDIDGGGLLA